MPDVRLAGSLARACVACVVCVMSQALPGCYGWQLGVAPSDAATDSIAPKQDAASPRVDATPPAKDAGASHDGGHAHPDAMEEAAAPDAGSCPSLAAAVDASLATACAITMPPECTTFVTDPCGCDVFVALQTSTGTQAYVKAVKALSAASCTGNCSGVCPFPGATSALCLSEATGSGVVSVCTPE